MSQKRKNKETTIKKKKHQRIILQFKLVEGNQKSQLHIYREGLIILQFGYSYGVDSLLDYIIIWDSNVETKA